jgi:hypothetical protein
MQPSNHQLILQYGGIMFCRGILRGVNKNRDEFECLDSFGGLLSGAIGRFRWGSSTKSWSRYGSAAIRRIIVGK